jgi:hypothetical protein
LSAVSNQEDRSLPQARVDVVESGTRARRGRDACMIDGDIKFSTTHLESYCLVEWEPVIFDALVLTAAIEFCDRTRRRHAHTWAREFELRIPVHEPARWNDRAVSDALHSALGFLTGDVWSISFVARRKPVEKPQQSNFDIPHEPCAVMPFSEGLDSRAVAGLMHNELGNRLIRVRLGSKAFEAATLPSAKKQPFTSIPYRVRPRELTNVESSARSRGFKFAMASGLAAYLIKAVRIIVPESGQGSLGPVLVPVGQAYEDYRNHPLFTDRMEKFLAALFGHSMRFEFPQVWQTKGETLSRFVKECADGNAWASTWSCWQQNRQVSVDHKKRQCGICAACMLRRLSVHAASLTESPQVYVWENLSAPTFVAGAAPKFRHTSRGQFEYAIAGTLHLDHLASFRTSPINRSVYEMTVSQLSRSRDIAPSDVRVNLDRLLAKHAEEWKNFLGSLGESSFVAKWAGIHE